MSSSETYLTRKSPTLPPASCSASFSPLTIDVELRPLRTLQRQARVHRQRVADDAPAGGARPAPAGREAERQQHRDAAEREPSRARDVAPAAESALDHRGRRQPSCGSRARRRARTPPAMQDDDHRQQEPVERAAPERSQDDPGGHGECGDEGEVHAARILAEGPAKAATRCAPRRPASAASPASRTSRLPTITPSAPGVRGGRRLLGRRDAEAQGDRHARVRLGARHDPRERRARATPARP